jgi:glucose-1-phosphate thymidylyltransferase
LPHSGARIFTYEVSNPSDYGVLEVSRDGYPISIFEKPNNPTSNLAITGLYFFDNKVSEIAKKIEPSPRGELEITSILNVYLSNNELSVTQLSRGTAWLDTGNADSMHEASSFVRIIEERTGLKIGCPEEIAFTNRWISQKKLLDISNSMIKSSYGKYLKSIIKD